MLQCLGTFKEEERAISVRQTAYYPLGVQAVKLIADGEYNKMTGIVNHQTTAVDLADVAGKVKYVPVDGD